MIRATEPAFFNTVDETIHSNHYEPLHELASVLSVVGEFLFVQVLGIRFRYECDGASRLDLNGTAFFSIGFHVCQHKKNHETA